MKVSTSFCRENACNLAGPFFCTVALIRVFLTAAANSLAAAISSSLSCIGSDAVSHVLAVTSPVVGSVIISPVVIPISSPLQIISPDNTSPESVPSSMVSPVNSSVGIVCVGAGGGVVVSHASN